MADKDIKLNRSLSLSLVTFYGLGNIVGAGIYVLIGKVAGHAGYFTPVSFILASLVAAITAFTFAELSSRYPLSAGEAVYIQNGFGLKQLSLSVGLLIVLTGIVSASTIARGFVGYLGVFIELPDWLVIIGLLCFLGGLAAWGITQSVRVAAIFTLIGMFGLVLVIYVTLPYVRSLPDQLPAFVPGPDLNTWSGIFLGAFLAFYAFIGFEDMVNVAEEVKEPEKNLPLSILLALTLATFFYIALAVSSLLVVSPKELVQSDAPLAVVYETATGNKPLLISIISLFAVVNGALIQIIMASRVCYGLSKQGWLPEIIGKVSDKTHTPVNATLLITLIIIVMALWLPIETLARATSYLLLVIFTLVNLALVRIKRRKTEKDNIFVVPMLVPVTGAITCIVFLLLQTLLVF